MLYGSETWKEEDLNHLERNDMRIFRTILVRNRQDIPGIRDIMQIKIIGSVGIL